MSESNLYIGLDMGDRKSHAAVLDEQGTTLATVTLATTPEDFRLLIERFPAKRIALETGTHAPWAARVLAEQGADVVVANARKVELIAKNHRKSDNKDRVLLARLVRADPALLHPVRMRSERSTRALQELGVRDGLVRARTRLVTTVRGMIKAHGHRVPSCQPTHVPDRVRATIPAQLVSLVEPLLHAITALNDQIKVSDARVTELGRHYPAVARLQRVPGVGPVTALAFVLVVDEPTRFKKSRDVGAYLGLCPRRDQSGKGDPQLRISKTGNGFLRRLLVNCAHNILRTNAPDSALARRGARIVERGGARPKKRAAVAIARSLAVVLHRMWVDGTDWRPSPPPRPPSISSDALAPAADSDLHDPTTGDCVSRSAEAQRATPGPSLQRPSSDPTVRRPRQRATKSANRSLSVEVGAPSVPAIEDGCVREAASSSTPEPHATAPGDGRASRSRRAT